MKAINREFNDYPIYEIDTATTDIEIYSKTITHEDFNLTFEEVDYLATIDCNGQSNLCNWHKNFITGLIGEVAYRKIQQLSRTDYNWFMDRIVGSFIGFYLESDIKIEAEEVFEYPLDVWGFYSEAVFVHRKQHKIMNYFFAMLYMMFYFKSLDEERRYVLAEFLLIMTEVVNTKCNELAN